MKRPEFTEEELKLIKVCQAREATPVGTILQWMPWVIAPTALFLYGFWRDVPECTFAGFLLMLYLVCMNVYYQAKPSWQMKPILDKFENAIAECSQQARGENGEPAPASQRPPEDNPSR